MRLKFDVHEQIILISIALGMGLLLTNVLFFNSYQIGVFSILILLGVPTTFEYIKYRTNREIEEKFPDFLRDVAESVRTGMTLPQAILAAKESYYGSLTPYVKRMVVQIDWGVPFDKILLDFSKKTTPLIKRTVSTIIEIHRSGGDIIEVFDSIGRSSLQVNKIKKERSATIYSQMLIGYVIFFIFVAVLIILQVLLIPNITSFSPIEETEVESLNFAYSNLFLQLVLIEGFFSGLIIGKMSEGTMIAGLKHALILLLIGLSLIHI